MTEKKMTHFKDGVLMYEGQHSIKCKSTGDIRKAAQADPDAQLQTEQQLKQFKRVKPFAKKK